MRLGYYLLCHSLVLCALIAGEQGDRCREVDLPSAPSKAQASVGLGSIFDLSFAFANLTRLRMSEMTSYL
eukprot:scaffold11485_cov152-Skeletonema_marinoi.AAC.7